MFRLLLAVGVTLPFVALVSIGTGARLGTGGAPSKRFGGGADLRRDSAETSRGPTAHPAADSRAGHPSDARAVSRGSPIVLRRALDATIDVERLPAPGPSDWLSHHEEPGQSYEEWRVCRRHTPDERHTTIRLAPLGDVGTGDFPSIDVLASYAETFFGMPARSIEASSGGPAFTTRKNPQTGQPQILTTDVLDRLREDLPGDAFCVIALTTTDLYPEPSWNYVFGQASFFDRTGVFSFARFDPTFLGEPRDATTPIVVLRRALKIMTHEIGHMFGIEHCVRGRCLMNGVNHLAEADATPMDVCPVCLAKLHHAIHFDVLARERALEAWRRAHGLDYEADRSAAKIARWTAPEAAAAAR